MLFNHSWQEKLHKLDHCVDPSRVLRAPHLVYNPKLISGVSKLLKTFDKPHGFISKTALEKKNGAEEENKHWTWNFYNVP